MRKYLFVAALAVAGLFAVPSGAAALMIAFNPAPQRALTAEVVIVGKVTAIEKDTVDAEPFPGQKQKVAYKIAVVKIETGLAGANNVTHVKIGFIPPPKVDPAQPVDPNVPIRPIRPRPGFMTPDLKEGTEMLFFLSKHHSAEFYTLPNMSPPIDVKTEGGKKELEQVKKIVALVAEPMKGLKSDKAEVRMQTAAALVQKYRAYPQFANGEPKQEAIDKDESKLILKAIVEADWKQQVRPVPGDEFGMFNPINAFYQLGLNEKDGWKPPMFPKVQPGQPRPDFNAIQKEAFVKWLDGAGKDYVIKKFVATKPNEK
jgi:hypothetical protein